MNLGESIRVIRQSKGLSQGEMQKRTGILRSYLSRVENGHTVPSFATLQRLATAMGLTLADFFSHDEGTALPAPPPTEKSGTASDYLQELKHYLPNLSPQQRQDLLTMIKEMAKTSRQ